MKFTAFLIALFAMTSAINCNAQTATTTGDTLVWYTDFSKANAASQASNKPIFGFFTGSDWCGWCHKLQREVFAKEAFVTWAKANVILLEVDFPRRKQLAPEIAQQNQGLQQAFQVRGYPTIFIFQAVTDPTNNKINLNSWGSLGYPSGAEAGKEEVKFLETANGIMAVGKK
jgi:thioredoxin-related protein